jgi:deoxyhypusine synthase
MHEKVLRATRGINMKAISITDFINANFKHFNAAVVAEAARSWVDFIKNGNKMFLTLAGAMSTAELGISLAEIIRRDKVHGISATAANLEEDIFNLVAHDHYRRLPGYRNLTAEEERSLQREGMNRVTDTCIPEVQAIRLIGDKMVKLWLKADQHDKSYFPYEYVYELIRSGELKDSYQIDPDNSWVIAACEKNLPIFTPGFEDSSLGNIFVANVIKGNLKSYSTIKSGLEQMGKLIDWYLENSRDNSIGFFQIGGGIAGDFPICVVPLIQQDLRRQCKFWGYFCQISDSTTSYGSYSGAVPNEKITWGKLDIDTPRFIIESDASIVAPLIFNYVLGN